MSEGNIFKEVGEYGKHRAYDAFVRSVDRPDPLDGANARRTERDAACFYLCRPDEPGKLLVLG